MGQTTNKIAATELVHVSEAGSSVACEKTSFMCLNKLEQEKFQVDLIATDRCPSIAKYMRQCKKEKHDFDLWHVTKSVKKKLFKKMKRKNCAELADWTKATTNHLWWSAKTCGGDERKLKESWLSLKYHTVNKHSWKIGKRKYATTNHLWWSAKACGGDEKKLKETWLPQA